MKDINVSLPSGGVINANKGLLDIENSLVFESDFAIQDVSEESIKNIIKPYIQTENAPDEGIEFGIDSAAGRLSGPIIHPLAWLGEANLGLRNLRVGKEKIFDSLTAVYSSDKNGTQISKDRLR